MFPSFRKLLIASNSRTIAKSPRTICSRNAFTLLELLVVLVILAMVAAIVAPRLSGVHSRMGLETAKSNIVRADRFARNLASVRQFAVVVHMDLSRNRIWCSSDHVDVANLIELPASVRIKRFKSSREQKTTGLATVNVWKFGGGESYAVELESRNKPGTWIVFAGLSGHYIETDSHDDVQKIFAALKK